MVCLLPVLSVLQLSAHVAVALPSVPGLQQAAHVVLLQCYHCIIITQRSVAKMLLYAISYAYAAEQPCSHFTEDSVNGCSIRHTLQQQATLVFTNTCISCVKHCIIDHTFTIWAHYSPFTFLIHFLAFSSHCEVTQGGSSFLPAHLRSLPTHLPSWHLSFIVQNLPSSHLVPSAQQQQSMGSS